MGLTCFIGPHNSRISQETGGNFPTTARFRTYNAQLEAARDDDLSKNKHRPFPNVIICLSEDDIYREVGFLF